MFHCGLFSFRGGLGVPGIPWEWFSIGKFHKAFQCKTKTCSHPNIIFSSTNNDAKPIGRERRPTADELLGIPGALPQAGRGIDGASTGCSCRRKQKWLDIANIPQIDVHSLTPMQTLGWLHPRSHASSRRKQILLLLFIWANLMFACGWPSSELPGVIAWMTWHNQINFHSSPSQHEY